MGKKYSQLLNTINSDKIDSKNKNDEIEMLTTKNDIDRNQSGKESVMNLLRTTKVPKKISKSFYLDSSIADQISDMAKQAGVSENKVINTLLKYIFENEII